MTGFADNCGASRWRTARWGMAAALLLIPLIAMQVTGEVNWDGFDFAAAAILIFGSLLAFELATRARGNLAYRAGIAVALAAAFMLVWINLAVGIIGSENNRANLLFAGVLAVGISGAILAGLQPAGMTRALLATALVQAAVGLIAIVAGWGQPASPPLELLGLTGLFTALWVVSAWLFRRTAPPDAGRSTAPSGTLGATGSP
jgi:hypothetical protein